jgi:hypothetical protein
VGANSPEILSDGTAEFLGVGFRILLEDEAVYRDVQNEETRARKGFYVEKIGEIVGDDAVVGFAGSEDLEERDKAGVGRDGAHCVVPATRVAAGEADDDIERAVKDVKLVDPRFVAVEH